MQIEDNTPKSKKYRFILPVLAFLFIYSGLKIIDNFSSGSTNQEPSVAGAKTETTQSQAINFKEPILPPKLTSESTPNVNASAYFALDVASGYPLAAHNADDKRAFASTTKLMTAIVAIENYSLDDVVTVSKNSAAEIGSDIQLRTGEKLTVKELLKGLLIQSGNDCAVALAEHMGLENFVNKMNDKARLLGMDGTLFKSPSGLDDTATSTARDLAILGAFAIRKKEILDITKIQEANVTSIDNAISHHVQNSNRLIVTDHPLYLPYVEGLKTGFTPEAGHLLITTANKDGHRIVTVVMDSYPRGPESSARESRRLIEWVYNSYTWN